MLPRRKNNDILGRPGPMLLVVLLLLGIAFIGALAQGIVAAAAARAAGLVAL